MSREVRTGLFVFAFCPSLSPMLLCYHGVALPYVADREDGLHIWMTTAMVLKEELTAEKAWYYSLGIERGPDNCIT